MQKVLLAVSERMSFPLKALIMLMACALAFLASPTRGQDDNAAPPPPPDNSAPAQAPDDSSSAPDDSASFQTFYDALGSQGTWIQSSDYGYVWQPQVSDPDWAPYTDGHWVYTDDGWTWVSDESWGWATYHYGRWVNLDGTGWCWVPGYTWAPAWVSWRYGDGYCGWAPLPPDSFVGVDYSDDGSSIGVGFHIGGDCDDFYDIGPGCYIFLPVTCLGYRHYHGYYRHRGDNYAIINHTTNVTNINVTRGGGASGGGSFHHVSTGGPMLSQVNAVSTTPVQRVSLVRSTQPGGGGTLSGNSLSIYAPRVNSGPTAQPTRVAGSIGRVAINRGTDITQPLAVNQRLAPAPPTEAEVQQARIAQDHAPASAKVVTSGEAVQPVLQEPLTSLKPVTRPEEPTPVFNTAPATTFNSQRTSPAPSVNPSYRMYYPQNNPSAEVPSRTTYPGQVYQPSPSPYQPHSTAPAGTGGQTQAPQTYVRPAAPAYSPPASPQTQSTYHQSAGGSSGGGGGYSSGGSGGGYHGGGTSGGNSSQSH